MFAMREPPPAWLAVAYDSGADDMAASVVYTIGDLAVCGRSSAEILDAVAAVVIGRLEVGLPRDDWFRNQGGGS